ncbi:MAG: methionine--tRNA ligase [Clostridia bacterium]|nr:methionine--tRNA ligase [Clostridia bacterium]
MKQGKYYITTAIAYTSSRPHIGNSYEAVMADAMARYMRMAGYDVFFQTGTDEHGQKIQDKAKEADKTPKEYVDEIAAAIKSNWDLLGTSYDKFIRTTDEDHEKKVQEIFTKLYDKGDIYKGHYEGLYCTPCESFWTETQLLNGNCPDCGRPVIQAKEEAYFLKLSKYQEALIRHIEENPQFIQPESRKNEMINNFLKPGLQDLCVSRTSFDWGVKVPFDEKHVIYVWIDALSNYITGIGYDAKGNHSDLFNKFWPANVHLIGKDILRFHTIYWPILLMALDLPLPKQVFGHSWLLVGEGKMSKSKGNAIYAEYLVKHFGVDAVRYYLLSEMPFAQDGSITYELVIERINSDLANTLGNLVNRTITMTQKYFDGMVLPKGEVQEIDNELISLAMALPDKVKEKMEQFKIADAINEIFNLLRRSNKYIDETAPWVLGKEEKSKGRLATVLYNLLESIRFSAVLLTPFIPETASKILDQLNTSQRSLDSLQSFDGMAVNRKLNLPEILFARIDGAKKLEEMENEQAIPKKDQVPSVSFDDFSKLSFKVAKVVEATAIEGSDKLLKLIIDLGDEKRQIVSGIAHDYKPEHMVGKNVVVITNLQPVKIKGVLSEGMILATDDKNGLHLIVPDSDTEPGSKVR